MAMIVGQIRENNIFAYVKGMPFGDWITADARSNGHSAGDLIETPSLVIESLIRDEILSERDLVESNITLASNYIEFNGSTNFLLNTNDDYYNGAYLHCVNKDWVKEITDYDGANKRIYVSSLTTGEIDAVIGNNKFYITNIQANIDTASFDLLGNTTNGSRKDWKFARSINRETQSEELLNSALFESHSILFTTYEDFRIKALDSAPSSVGTLSNPLKVSGTPQMFIEFTPLEDIYTDFTLNYGYDYAKQNYRYSHTVNKNTSSNSTYLGTTYKNYCKDAETNYKVKKAFTYDSEWIQDSITGFFLIQKICRWFTKQKMIITYLGDIESHLKYEEGDLVLVNYPRMMPTAKNNSQKFMVIEKTIIPDKFDPQVRLRLLEIPT